MAYGFAASTIADAATATSASIAYASGGSVAAGQTEVIVVYAPSATAASFSVSDTGNGGVGFTGNWQVNENVSQAFVATRKVNGGESGNFTVKWTTTSTYIYAHFVVSGVDPAITIEVGTYSQNSSSATITTATLTPQWNADFLVGVYLTNTPHAVTINAALTSETAYTGTNLSGAVGYETFTSNAATGALNGSCGTAATNLGVLLAFRTQQTSGLLLPVGGAYSNTAPVVYAQSAAPISGVGT